MSTPFRFFVTVLFLSCAFFISSKAQDFETAKNNGTMVPSASPPVNGESSTGGDDGDEQGINGPDLVLAPRRTYRKDPLNHFSRYAGGWNLHDRHYWASVAYSSSTLLFVIAALWFLAFGLFLVLTIFFHCRMKKPSPPPPPHHHHRRRRAARFEIPHTISLVLLILFGAVAAIGCVISYTGQEKFRSGLQKSLNLLETQADSTSSTLKNMSESFSTAKQVNVLSQVSLPPTVQNDVDRVQSKLDSAALTLTAKPDENSAKIKKFTDSTKLGLILVSIFIVLLISLGLGYSIFDTKHIVYVLPISGWLVITGAFVICGIFLTLHEATGDACASMAQWAQNPKPNTALEDLLPCVDSDASMDALNMTKEATSQLVDVINTVITNVSNINFAPNFVQFYYNQSGPLVPSLCNPFRRDLTDRECAGGEVALSDASRVLGGYVCGTSPSGICVTVGRLNPSLYGQLNGAVAVGYGLYRSGSFLVELGECEFAKRTFSDVRGLYCDGLVKGSRQVCVGLALAAVAAALFLGVWVVYATERRRRFDGSKSRGHVYVKEASSTRTPRRD